MDQIAAEALGQETQTGGRSSLCLEFRRPRRGSCDPGYKLHLREHALLARSKRRRCRWFNDPAASCSSGCSARPAATDSRRLAGRAVAKDSQALLDGVTHKLAPPSVVELGSRATRAS